MELKKCPHVLRLSSAILGMLLVQVPPGFAITPPTLSNPSFSNNHFEFVWRGETNLPCVVEASTNLQTWAPVLTNIDAQATRLIVVPANAAHHFWRVRVPGPVFVGALAAREQVNLSGNSLIDSFDSTDTNYSTGGKYDPTKRKDGGDVVSSSRAPGAVNVGNTQIAGTVRTGPGGSVTIGPNGAVGSTAWLVNPVNDGRIEPGYARDDFHFTFPDPNVPNPFGPVLPIGPGIYNGTNYTYLLSDADYRVASLNMSGSQRMFIRERVRLHVTGNFSLSGSAAILLDSGATLQLYAGGTSSLGAHGVVNPGNATNFQYYGLASSASLSISQSASLSASIYAPRADATIVGVELSGACVTRTVTVTGQMPIHYDENLRQVGPVF